MYPRHKDLILARIIKDLNNEVLTGQDYLGYRVEAIYWDGEILIKLIDPDTGEVESYGKIVIE